MNFLSRSPSIRNTASFMLAVWLFVLASGFVNGAQALQGSNGMGMHNRLAR